MKIPCATWYEGTTQLFRSYRVEISFILAISYWLHRLTDDTIERGIFCFAASQEELERQGLKKKPNKKKANKQTNKQQQQTNKQKTPSSSLPGQTISQGREAGPASYSWQDV